MKRRMMTSFDRDLYLMSGAFLEEPLPKEKEYLYHYFRTYVQQVFAKYYYDVGSTEHFIRHTGVYACDHWLKKLRIRFEVVEKAYARAKEEGDFETLAMIKSGNYPVPVTNPERRKKRDGKP
jgi:hypothetical protein